ncbi:MULTISPECIES: hypothetical protein [Halorussus]|nr:hypothetical protein [Halorussus vallis]USZ74052.1 hypothetical protein NGM07_11355 [Halorussus vallis]
MTHDEVVHVAKMLVVTVLYMVVLCWFLLDEWGREKYRSLTHWHYEVE